MTLEEAIKMANATLECIERETSGQDKMCNNHMCDECNLNYERGNIGEYKEWLRMAINALELQYSDDCISKQKVIEILDSNIEWVYRDYGCKTYWELPEWKQKVVDINQTIKGQILMILSPMKLQQEKGHWIRVDKDKVKCSKCEVIHFIAQYPQSARIDYCPNCGTRMEGIEE